MKYWVYIHTFPNGKKYVGLTTRDNPEYRWNHGRGYGSRQVKLNNAIQKYGWENVKHEVFEVDDLAQMNYLERYLIAFYNTIKNGYNISPGGDGQGKHSAETRRRLSEAQKGKPRPWQVGRKYSEESKQKMRESQHTLHRDPEYLAKLSKAKKGKPLTKFLFQTETGERVWATRQNQRCYHPNWIEIKS